MFASDDVAWSEPSILSGLARKVEMQVNNYDRTFEFGAYRNSVYFFFFQNYHSSGSCRVVSGAFEVFHISLF